MNPFPLVGQVHIEDGQRCTAWHFRSEAEANDFVFQLMDGPNNNTAAGFTQLDSGAWRVVLKNHYDA